MHIIDTLESKLLLEAVDSKTVKIRGVLGKTDYRNGNGRYYPNRIMESAIRKLNEDHIPNRKSFIYLGHNNTTEDDVAKACGLLTKLTLRNNLILGEGIVLDSDAGKMLVSLYKNKSSCKFSTRGLGSVNESGVVQSDYILRGADIMVGEYEASVDSTFVELVESLQAQQKHPFETELDAYNLILFGGGNHG